MTTALERDPSLSFELLPIEPLALLRPIASDQGAAGPFLLYDEVYDRIRRARQADNPNLPQGIWETDIKRADWEGVIALACDTLCHRSKDLQLAVWLAEAAVQRYGFAGLAEALTAIRALALRFWADLHPQWETDDPSARLAPLEWLSMKLPPTLRLVPLTQPSLTDETVYRLADWDSARHEARAKDDAPTRTTIRTAMQTTDLVWRQKTAGDLRRSLDELRMLVAVLEEQCGQEAPSLGELSRTLLEAEQFLLPNSGGLDMSHPPTPETGEPSSRPAGAVPSPVPGRALDLGSAVIHGRDDAYAKLAHLADYLIELEPHSPAPYLVRRAVAWGQMPLPALLKELGRQYGDVDRVIATLGLADGEGGRA